MSLKNTLFIWNRSMTMSYLQLEILDHKKNIESTVCLVFETYENINCQLRTDLFRNSRENRQFICTFFWGDLVYVIILNEKAPII